MQWTVGRVTFMEGERLEGVLVHCGDGYFYHRHHDRPLSPFISLRCARRKRKVPCWGTAIMSRDGQHFECTRAHLHGPDPWFVEDKVLRRSVMQAVASGDPAPYSVIIRNVGLRGRFSLEARSRMTVARMRTAMREERLGYFPEIPATLFHLGLALSQPQYSHVTATIDGQDNIFAGTCGDFAGGTFSVVFMSQRLSYQLQNAKLVFGDGTFKKRPRKPMSNQLFVISTVWYSESTSSKHIVTCARILMQRRTADAYKSLFHFLKTLMPFWNPDIIMCDHELAQVQGWMWAFPNAAVTTCLFHFAVDVFRNARGIGLEALMRESELVDCTVRCLAVLPLLPANLIQLGLVAMGYWARYVGAMQNPLVRDLFTYMHRQWIPAIHYLSVFGMENRTNNVSESVNSTLGLEIREDRPNVYFLIGAMKRLEDQAVVDLFALQRGRPAGRLQQLRTLRNDARIRNLTDSLVRGNINVVNFLMEASSCLQAPYEHVFG